jgi:hypothetical protein
MAKARSAGGITIDMSLGLAQISKDLNTLNNSLNKQFSQIQAGFKKAFTLGGIAVGLVGAERAVVNLMKSMTALAKAGERAGDIKGQFQALGGSAPMIKAASDALLGTVGSTELMRVANIGLLRQFPDLNKNFVDLSKYGMALSEVQGTDVVGALDQVMNAMAKAKPKSLERIGIVIDEKKAYMDYAKALGIVAATSEEAQKRMSAGQQKDAIRIAALEEMREKMKSLAPITDSVTKAHEAFEVTLSGVRKQIALQINDNPQLIKGWRDLGDIVKTIDWEQLAKDVSELAGNLLGLAQNVLPSVIRGIDTFALGLNTMFRESNLTKAMELTKQIESIDSKLNILHKFPSLTEVFDDQGLEKEKADLIEQRHQIHLTMAAEDERAKELKKNAAERLAAEGNLRTGIKKTGEVTQAAMDEAVKAAEKEQKVVEALTEKWQDWQAAAAEKTQMRMIDYDIESQNFAQFEADIAKLREAINAGMQDEINKWLEKGIATEEEIAKYREDKFANQINPLYQKYWDKGAETNKKLAEDWQRQYEDALDTWTSLFEDALNGESQDWKQNLNKMLAGFAGALAAATTGGITAGVKNATNLGGTLADLILAGFGMGPLAQNSGAGLGPNGNAWGNAYGTGSSATGGRNATNSAFGPRSSNSAGYPDSFVGPLPEYDSTGQKVQVQSDQGLSWAAAAVVAMNTLTSALNAEAQNKEEGNYSGTGAAIGTAVGAVIGGVLGSIAPGVGTTAGAMIGSSIGNAAGSIIGSLFHPGGNIDSKARHNFASWIEEQFRDLSTMAFKDRAGNLHLNRGGENFNFLEGDGAFDSGTWADRFNALPEDAKRSWTGLGNAIQNVLGLTDKTGVQIAYLMETQVGQSIDNARLMVRQLGLDFETLSKALEDAAMRGQIRWAEYNQQMAGLGDAFEKGLEGVGKYDQAMGDLIASGGRGMAAVVSFQNIGIEAIEAGCTTIEDLRQRLLDAGYSVEQVDALINAAAGRGITNLQDWANVSDQAAGQIVGDMESFSATLTEKWQEIGDGIDDLNNKLNEIPKDIVANIHVKVDGDPIPKITDGEIDPDPDPSPPPSSEGTGRVKSGANLDLVGKVGPDSLRSLSRVNGRLGTYGKMEGASAGESIVVNVDARGAHPGVERTIKAAIAEMEVSIIRRTVKTLSSRGMR